MLEKENPVVERKHDCVTSGMKEYYVCHRTLSLYQGEDQIFKAAYQTSLVGDAL